MKEGFVSCTEAERCSLLQQESVLQQRLYLSFDVFWLMRAMASSFSSVGMRSPVIKLVSKQKLRARPEWLFLLSGLHPGADLVYELVSTHPAEELNCFITATHMLNHGAIPKINLRVLRCATELSVCVCVFLFYEREWRCMHVTHRQSVYYRCASVHVWVPLPTDILQYVLTYLLTLHLTIEHTVFYLFMWLFPGKLSTVSLNVRCPFSQHNGTLATLCGEVVVYSCQSGFDVFYSVQFGWHRKTRFSGIQSFMKRVKTVSI